MVTQIVHLATLVIVSLMHKTKKYINRIGLFCATLVMLACNINSPVGQVIVLKNEEGIHLQVDNRSFMIKGMNWDYYPIGTNYTYSLWVQPEEVILAALDNEMSLLKNMGINTIRVYTGIPPKWITYIYENYGIYTLLNHSFGRYGLTIDGSWVANTDYADPRVKEQLITEVTQMVKSYKETPGLLLYLLGNENNYGLFWEGAETEDIPLENRKATIRARAMYKLFNEATLAIKTIDTNHPVAICNGDLLYLEIIAEECQDIDIFGTNMYRGITFGDAFQRVKEELNKPIMFTELGADAYNAMDGVEDQKSQAYYILNNWKEIYMNAAGCGHADNAIGGFTFQFSDGWWKYGQTENLDIHDTGASWANGGYTYDYEAGKNNMNEEWFGICAKGPANNFGLYELYPRAAYYVLQQTDKFDPYANEIKADEIDEFFDSMKVTEVLKQLRDE